MADDRLSVYDRTGAMLDRLKATFQFTEALNEFGQAEFTLAVSDAKCTERNLNPGNYVLYEHVRLGQWAGVIAPNNGQGWNSDDTITTRCFSAEYQFHRRRAPLNDVDAGGLLGFIHGTEGEIIERLIGYANLKEDALLRNGNIWKGGGTRMVQLRYAMLNEPIAHILNRSGLQFWVTPYFEKKFLRFAVHLQPTRGSDSGFVLRERINMEMPGGEHHRRDGTLVNDVVTGSKEGGPDSIGEAADMASRIKYGLWEGNEYVEGDSQAVAQARADAIIAESSDLLEKDQVAAIESVECADTFAHIGLGDVVRVQKNSVRFYGSTERYWSQGQIISREWSNAANKCILNLEKVA